MSLVVSTRGVGRSTVYDCLAGSTKARWAYTKAGDADLLPHIRQVAAQRPTYGYRRIAAVLNRQQRAEGLTPLDHKRVYCTMAADRLLLARRGAVPLRRATTKMLSRPSSVSSTILSFSGLLPWMEMLTPTTARVVARYKHPSWPADAGMTRNTWGKGEVTYVGFMPSDALVGKIVASEVERAGVAPSVPGARFPVIVRTGRLKNGHIVHYVLNYSTTEQKLVNAGAGIDLLHGRQIAQGEQVTLAPWDVAVIEEIKAAR